ncbi:hypothetical protein AB6V29_09410 [Microbacterium sp. 20-116]|uniref:hypothetical protein n=1 Tax=Microbacterium sp. 20-116 TaxID=3239883 RepID=UPI0034E26B84
MVNGLLIPSPMNGTPPRRVPASAIDARKSTPVAWIWRPNCASWSTAEKTVIPAVMLSAMSTSAMRSTVT